MKLKNYFKIILSLFIFISGLTSTYYLTANRREIKKNFGKVNQRLFSKIKIKQIGDDKFWAKEILNGGYILFFRHAERNKWSSVKMFDAIEVGLHNNGKNGTRFAENEYFKDAVCLNKKGEVQAQGMREIIEFSNLPIGNIISSPSCRARQTAELAFGKYDALNKNLLFSGVFSEKENERQKFLKDYLLNLSIKEGTNTIITAHNGVISDEIFDQIDKMTKIGEGGFAVISNKDNKLIKEHTFYSFSNFTKIFFTREFE